MEKLWTGSRSRTLGLSLPILLIVLLGSCSSGKEKEGASEGRRKKIDTVQQEGADVDSTTERKGKTEPSPNRGAGKASKGKGPIEPFLALTDTLAAHGWSADTTRMAEEELYPGFEDAEIRSFDGRPFYRMKPEKTRVLSGMGFRDLDFKKELAAFRKAESVWGYFYRLDSATNWIVDGVIEQWKFEKEVQVKKAMKALRQADTAPFFNTRPYFHTLGPYLFIFHARAMDFSYEQKLYYELFKKMSKGYEVEEK